MKKYFILFCSLLLSVCVVTPIAVANKGHCDLTGRDWEESSVNEKLSFLYGVSSVVVIEQEIAHKEGRAPSLFVRQWIKTFKDDTWSNIQHKIDKWYEEHPTQKSKDVLWVLWYEFMSPNVK